MSKVKTATPATPATPAEKKIDSISYSIVLPDGNKIEGTTSLREFAPNMGKGFKNSGFQVKVQNGNYSGSIMLIDYLRQVKI